MVGLVALGVVAVLYALSAGRLDRWSIGAPIVFLVAGIALGPAVTGLLDPHDSEPVKVVTELTLALILFADASTIGLRRIRGDAVIPVRVLLVGLRLTIGLGSRSPCRSSEPACLCAPASSWDGSAPVAWLRWCSCSSRRTSCASPS